MGKSFPPRSIVALRLGGKKPMTGHQEGSEAGRKLRREIPTLSKTMDPGPKGSLKGCFPLLASGFQGLCLFSVG